MQIIFYFETLFSENIDFPFMLQSKVHFQISEIDSLRSKFFKTQLRKQENKRGYIYCIKISFFVVIVFEKRYRVRVIEFRDSIFINTYLIMYAFCDLYIVLYLLLLKI